jgi:hypothetical protein
MDRQRVPAGDPHRPASARQALRLDALLKAAYSGKPGTPPGIWEGEPSVPITLGEHEMRESSPPDAPGDAPQPEPEPD